MKKLNLLPLLAIMMLLFAAPNYAQKNNDGNKTITIIKKYIDANGVETIEQTTTTTSGDENHIFFNSDGENIESIEIEDVELLTGEISKQLEELEIEFDNETAYIFKGNGNISSGCNSQPTPFLGVVTQSSENGATIKEVVSGSAAEAAGLKAGDKITSLAGKSTNKTSELSCAIKKQKVDEAVTIIYTRNGQSMQTTATLKAKTNGSSSSFKLDKKIEGFMRGNIDRNYNYTYNYNNNYKVDPCKVFIGVYTSSHTHRSGEGLGINGIIDNTPAQEAGLQKGDIIIAMDGINVNNHRELLNQRNTHSQGEQFTITYKRNDQHYTVDAEFKSCKEEESEVTETPGQTTIEQAQTQAPQVFNNANNELGIELRAFPNPSNRSVNVRFEGDRVPTTVTITDINGKEVYRDFNRNFDGIYNEKIDLKEAGTAQGTVIITVTQNGKTTSEKILYIQGRA